MREYSHHSDLHNIWRTEEREGERANYIGIEERRRETERAKYLKRT